MQVGKFLENIKRAGWNRRAGGKFYVKSINAGWKFSGKSIIVQVILIFETEKVYFDMSIELFITNLDFLTKL